MFPLLIITVFTSLLISYLSRRSKHRIFIWFTCSFIALIPLIFILLFIIAQNQTPEFKTLTCGSDKFYYTKAFKASENDDGYIAKNGDKLHLAENMMSLLLRNKNSYTALYNLPTELDKTKDFAQLLSCKEFDLNAMYQPYQPVNLDNLSEIRNKDRCYLLNRTGETDYPECSPEIKAKFELK